MIEIGTRVWQPTMFQPEVYVVGGYTYYGGLLFYVCLSEKTGKQADFRDLTVRIYDAR